MEQSKTLNWLQSTEQRTKTSTWPRQQQQPTKRHRTENYEKNYEQEKTLNWLPSTENEQSKTPNWPPSTEQRTTKDTELTIELYQTNNCPGGHHVNLVHNRTDWNHVHNSSHHKSTGAAPNGTWNPGCPQKEHPVIYRHWDISVTWWLWSCSDAVCSVVAPRQTEAREVISVTVAFILIFRQNGCRT